MEGRFKIMKKSLPFFIFLIVATILGVGCRSRISFPKEESEEVGLENGVYVLTDANFHHEINTEGIVLVDFWINGCPPCVKQAAVIKELLGPFRDKVKFAKIHADRYREHARDYNIRAFPTLLLFKDGKLQEQLLGLHDKPALEMLLNKMLNDSQQETHQKAESVEQNDVQNDALQ